MTSIYLLSAFHPDAVQLKLDELCEKQFFKYSLKPYDYNETSFKDFLFALQSLNLFSSQDVVYVLKNIPVSGLKKCISSFIHFSALPPIILTTGYIKVADPVRDYLKSLKELSFFSLKDPSDMFSFKIKDLAKKYNHTLDAALFSYLLFLYKDSFSLLEEDVASFLMSFPEEKNPLTVQDFMQFRSFSFVDVEYYTDRIIQKDFLFSVPNETFSSSEIIPFLRFLSFSFLHLLSPPKEKSFFPRKTLSWNLKDIHKILSLLHFFEIQAKHSTYTSFNAFLSSFQIILLKQQWDPS